MVYSLSTFSDFHQDIFRSPCTSDVNKEDIMLAIEVTMEGLKRLWGVDDRLTMSAMELAEKRETLQSIAESIAGTIYIKVQRVLTFRLIYCSWEKILMMVLSEKSLSNGV